MNHFQVNTMNIIYPYTTFIICATTLYRKCDIGTYEYSEITYAPSQDKL